MFKKIFSSLIEKNKNQNVIRNDIVLTNQKTKKVGSNIPKMLNLDTIDYFPLPPAPNKWESSPPNIAVSSTELFEIDDSSDGQINIFEVRKLSRLERPDPAYKIIMPSTLGYIEIDKNGKVKNLSGSSSAMSLRDKNGNFVKEVGLDHSIYRIGLDHLAKHFVLMDKNSILHVYNEYLDKIRSLNLKSDPRVRQIRESDVNFYGDVRTSIRCVDVTNDGNSTMFTVADSAFFVDINGKTIWARSMPLGEGWVREFAKGERVGTSQEVTEALSFMKLTLPATREQIRKQYRNFSLEYHPDLNREFGDRGEMMKTLNRHHEILTGMDTKELSNNPKIERFTYRRVKPDTVKKFHLSQNNISYEISVETNLGGPALDWIYAAAISNKTGGTYLGTYSGKVVKLNSFGEPEYALDVSNVPREIIEVDQFLYILTDTRLYIVGEEQSLINIVDVHGKGKIAVNQAGFGLYSNKSLSWYTPTGKYKFSLGTKHPLRTFYTSGEYLVIETRQHRAYISFNEHIDISSIKKPKKPEKQIINRGTGKIQAEKERQEKIDAQAKATLENLPSLKRGGRYKEAIKVLIQEVKKQEDEDKNKKWGVAPWSYGELAKIYRKQKDFKNEIKILKRYMKQNKAHGVMPKKLSERLEKAEALFDKSEQNK